MAEREPIIPSQITIAQFMQEVEAFRIVGVPDVTHPDLPSYFRSHHAENKKPRYEETEYAAIHMAVSLWRTFDRAAEIARRWPRLGGNVARLVLRPGQGFSYWTEDPTPGHLTIWGDPLRLAQCVVDIVSVSSVE